MHQDKADDLQVGVKSTALRLGESTGPWLVGFSGAMITCLTVTGYTAGLAWPYYAAVAATAGHLAHQVRRWYGTHQVGRWYGTRQVERW